MKPPPFAYHAPSSLDEALALMGQHGDEAKVLAGGQSLVPLLAMRLARPAVLVDLRSIGTLTAVVAHDGGVSIGSMVTERVAERSELVRSHAPLLSDALPLIGHDAIRTRGTVGGSVAHADPAAELPAVAIALDATFVARSEARGERTIAAADFFRGFLTTALEDDEILTEVRVPSAPSGTGTCFEEISRRHRDFAMVGVGASVILDAGTITDARFAMTNMSDVPVRVPEAEQILVGEVPSGELFAAVAARAVRDLSPSADLHASSDYRRRVGAVLVRRALETAARRATGAM